VADLSWYLLSVLAFALAYDERRVLVTSGNPSPPLGPYPILFNSAAWLGGIACIALLIAGFFIGPWWGPLVAMAVGTGSNLYGRVAIPDNWRWLATFAATGVGIGAGVMVIRDL